MGTHRIYGAAAPGSVTPATSDEAPAGGTARGFRDGHGKADGQDSAAKLIGTGTAPQALRVIEGETKAREYLARLHAQQSDPDELALIVAALYGATLRGFCRVIEKAIGGPR